MTSCPIHGIAVCDGATCVACESIRDGYPHGRGAPEAVKVVELMVAGPRWFVVCKGCHVVAGIYDRDPLASGEGDPRVELPTWYETESGEKWWCCEAFELAIVGPCEIKGGAL